MFSHVMVGSNNLAKSKSFYDPLFSAIGAKPGRQDEKGRLIYAHRGAAFMVTKPIDGNPATHANGGTIGFLVNSAEEANAWHKARIENGGTAIEDPLLREPRSGTRIAHSEHFLLGQRRQPATCS